MLNRIYHLKF